MELIPSDVELFHGSLADFDAFLVDVRVEGAFGFEPGLGCGCCDELDDGRSIRERPAAPVLRDAAEQTMLYPIPFRRTRRVVPDIDLVARGVNETTGRDLMSEAIASVVKAPASN